RHTVLDRPAGAADRALHGAGERLRPRPAAKPVPHDGAVRDRPRAKALRARTPWPERAGRQPAFASSRYRSSAFITGASVKLNRNAGRSLSFTCSRNVQVGTVNTSLSSQSSRVPPTIE